MTRSRSATRNRSCPACPASFRLREERRSQASGVHAMPAAGTRDCDRSGLCGGAIVRIHRADAFLGGSCADRIAVEFVSRESRFHRRTTSGKPAAGCEFDRDAYCDPRTIFRRACAARREASRAGSRCAGQPAGSARSETPRWDRRMACPSRASVVGRSSWSPPSPPASRPDVRGVPAGAGSAARRPAASGNRAAGSAAPRPAPAPRRHEPGPASAGTRRAA